MKNTLALVLMVFGLVGCATATDGKFVSPFASQSSHKDPHWFGEKIVSSYEDLTLKFKAQAINTVTNEKFFYAIPGGYIDSEDILPTITNNDAIRQAYVLCEYYAKPYGMFEYVDSEPEVCIIDKVGDAQFIGTHNKKGRFHGNGTLIFANGDRFEGGFMNGKLHGSGTMYWADGRYILGNFRNDKFVAAAPDNSNISNNNFLEDVITTTGQIILGSLYIAVAIAGSPEALEYQENKNQKAKEAAAYEKGKRDGAIRAERARSTACKVTRNC